ncbi:MAG TPA: DUF2336 domain-containing protein [Steroidobacteraceae bacterium]|nr:DUF2336 domain-containing protein [Steroidobacteraceae bacterium]
MADNLTQVDVERLLADPSPETRADMAAKVAHEFRRGRLTGEERRIAEEIVRVMAHDAALRVRQALAEHLKESNSLPPDVARLLAMDVEAVAVPVLQYSTVLTDEDLLDLVKGASSEKLTAIARRPTLSEPVSDAVVHTDDPAAITALVGNEGARIGEPSLKTVLTRHGAKPEVGETLARRSKLPISILEGLVSAASDRLREVLIGRHDLPERLASDLVFQARERATVGLVSPQSPMSEALELAAHLKKAGRLTPSIVLRALCLGDLTMVEAAFSTLGRIPVHNARLMIHDAGPLGFKSLYDHVGMPRSLFRAFRVALDVARDTPLDGGEHDQERRQRRMIERILTQFEDIGADNLDFLLSKLQEKAESEAVSA